MRERVWGGRTALWFLVEGNRLVVTAVLLVVGYSILVLFSLVAPGSTTKPFDPDPVFALFTGAAFGAGIAPFAVFLSYILRIVIIAKWTLAIGPFVLRKTREDEDIGWG